MILDHEVLEKLRCSVCRNYLSVLPVHSYGGEQHVCGRCPVKEEFFPQRALLYEAVIEGVNFPCQYEAGGCPERTVPDDMGRHEAACSYRPFRCPSLLPGQCEFQGGVPDLWDHFAVDHPDSVFKNVELDIVNVYERNYVYFESPHVFLIVMKCNKFEGKLFVQVKYLNNETMAESFSFLMQFSRERDGTYPKSHDVAGKVTFSDSNNLDHFKPYETIIIDGLKNVLNNPATIFCTIKVNKIRLGCDRSISVVEEKLLRTIECPVCFCYMVPPILQCARGHSFCKSCHEKLENCPLCQQAMSDSQNFCLEAITLEITYPCKYQQYDCSFYGSANEIRKHEDACPFGPILCVVEGCGWKGNFEKLLDHVKEFHHDEYLDVNSITYIVDPDFSESQTYIISKFGNVFRILFKDDGDAFQWNLQLIGPDTDHAKYILELDFKSPVSSERIYYRKLCNSAKKSEDAFLKGEGSIELTYVTLEGMIDDNVLTYCCNVAQV